MARYIDAELLTDNMLVHYNDLCEKHGDYDHYTTGYGDAIDAIDNAPTADVVPKSEVESTENRCKELEQIAEYQQNLSVKRYFEIKRLKEDVERLQDINENQVGDIRRAKTEVAREIFEEIEKAIVNLEYQANTRRKTIRVDELKAQVNWVLHEVIPATIAELKKKYTGGEE